MVIVGTVRTNKRKLTITVTKDYLLNVILPYLQEKDIEIIDSHFLHKSHGKWYVELSTRYPSTFPLNKLVALYADIKVHAGRYFLQTESYKYILLVDKSSY